MLNPQAIERLSQIKMLGPELIQMFMVLAETLKNNPAEQVAWTLGYIKDSELKEGDFVPIINLVLTRHNALELTDDSQGISTTEN